MIRPKPVKPRGILHLKVPETPRGYARYWPSAELAPYVEHFWTVEWDEPDPVVREVLPHPSVQLVLEAGSSRLAGVHTGRFTRAIEGRGRVLGTKFLPGGFRTFLDAPVSTLTDRVIPLAELIGADGGKLELEALACAEPVAAFAIVEAFLVARQPRRDAQAELACRLAERIAADREITRVEQVARRSALGVRALQRLFDEYVGVGPKWVIQRYRLHEATERIAAGRIEEWAALALELGYADQAHFIRDFRRMVGRSPADYARSFR